ncbi:MAG: hypothetical protein AAF567_25950 [Actinomycetota bacterium]
MGEQDSWPANWTWADGPVEAGPCVLVDVDGVIANGWHRQHFLQNGRRDWKNFFANAGGDSPIEGSVALLDQFSADLVVVLLTARPDNLRATTLGWLGEHGYRWDLLIQRGPGDRRYSSPDFKRRCVGDLRERGFEPQLALDDDQRNVDMFRDEDIETLYIHSGYYEA